MIKFCYNINYLISEKSGIADSINQSWRDHNWFIFDHNSLPIQKILTFHNVIIKLNQLLIKIQKNTTKIYFQKTFWIRINPLRAIFEWTFVYCKCYISIELMFLKEWMLIKQLHHYFLNYSFKFQSNVCTRWHDLFMMSMNLAILLFQTLKVLIIAVLLA